MTYTSGIPQANQTIAETQPGILGNFDFLPISIGKEHNFDATDPLKTYHLQASMPNLAIEPVALPVGTNGMYYIFGGLPKYYDGTTKSFIALSGSSKQTVLSGTLTLTPTPQAFFTAPANSGGSFYINKATVGGGQTGSFVASAATVITQSNFSPGGITVSLAGGLNTVISSPTGGVANYTVVIYT